MMSAQILRATLEVRRAAATDEVDEWLQPVATDDVTVATIAGQIQVQSVAEAAALGDDGPTSTDAWAITGIADIRTGDRIRDAATPDVVYEVRSVFDAAGVGHHMELGLHRVTP